MSGKVSVTRPQRRFGPADLAALRRQDVRKLVHALLEEAGAQVNDYTRAAAFDDLRASIAVLWEGRLIRIRIATRPVDQGDVTRLSDTVKADGDAGGWLVGAHGASGDLTLPDGIYYVSPEDLIERFERSSRVSWPNRKPALAMDRLSEQRTIQAAARLTDPLGLAWLPVVAHNELPAELSEDGEPQDWFERLAFRTLSRCFRFGGERFGEAARDKRLPDAYVTWPCGGASVAAMLDCKASADGYTMEADHYLRFKHYADAMTARAADEGRSLEYMIVLSSEFSGTGARHPFHARAKALKEDTGLTLAYLRAADLSHAGVLVEEIEAKPASRDRIDWRAVFDEGIVLRDHLVTAITESVKA